MNNNVVAVLVPPTIRAPRGAAWAASAAIWLAGKLGAKSARATRAPLVASPAAR